MDFRGQSPWDVLGIGAGAGASEVRRAYAKRLKEIRPDEDAEGFQRLVEARDLALQLASGARSEAPSVAVLFANTFDTSRDEPVLLELPHSEVATKPPTASTADPSPEISAPPAQPTQDVIDILHTALNGGDLTGWEAVVRSISALSHQQRAALEARVIVALSAFAAQESNNLAAWPPGKWPFFELIAALDEEFGWRESDRVLYEILDEQEVRDFIALLRWTRTLLSRGADTIGTDGHNQRLAPIALQDLHPFYNDGRDQRGLDAYWLMVNDPTLWRPCDAATYLFFPVWSWQDRRYAMAALGLLGWAALILVFAPWRYDVIFDALPWLSTLPKGGKRELESFAFILPVMVAFWYLVGSALRPSPQRATHLIGPLWDSRAFFLFPVWAIARRLYVRAAIGLIAWIAIAHQLHQLYGDGTPDLALLLFATILLVGMLHLTAGEYGQRWVVYKLQRSIAVTNRRRIFEPQQRADFLRQQGTRNESLQEIRPRKQRGAGYKNWWKWLLGVAIISAIIRLIDALLRFLPSPGH
jgi:hypothetical protein